MDGNCKDVLEYHVDYKRQTINVNTTHDFALKAHSPVGMRQMTIGFSVGEIGTSLSKAETIIQVNLQRDYSIEEQYRITDVTIQDNNNTIDYDVNGTSIQLVDCMAGSTSQCVLITLPDILFREQFYSEPFIIQAMDRDRRTSTHYMNEGILLQGESLNPAPTSIAGLYKPGNQYDAVPIELVRVDKLADLWEDQFGNTWTKNSVNTWKQLTFSKIEPRVDEDTNVMTRQHSSYPSLIQAEREKAALLFDSSRIQNSIGDTFSYELPEQRERLDAELLERLHIENQKAQELIDNNTQE